MFKGYSLNIKDIDFSSYLDEGKCIYKKNKVEVKNSLGSLQERNGELSAKEITESWFPNVEADVFLSHSHKDDKQVVGLSGWLSRELGLKAFVDSCVWGNSNSLLKIVDNKYCLNDSGKSYSYKKRNRSTSHLHMMLSVALSKMIDSCECVIFINTPSSISAENCINGDGDKTYSPWIYHEIATTSMIRIKVPDRHKRYKTRDAAMEIKADSAGPIVSYNVDLSHLEIIDLNRFEEIRKLGLKGVNALDKIYGIKQ